MSLDFEVEQRLRHTIVQASNEALTTFGTFFQQLSERIENLEFTSREQLSGIQDHLQRLRDELAKRLDE